MADEKPVGISVRREPSNGPCDGCGRLHNPDSVLPPHVVATVVLSNAKAFEYRLPGLVLCLSCQYDVAAGFLDCSPGDIHL